VADRLICGVLCQRPNAEVVSAKDGWPEAQGLPPGRPGITAIEQVERLEGVTLRCTTAGGRTIHAKLWHVAVISHSAVGSQRRGDRSASAIQGPRPTASSSTRILLAQRNATAHAARWKPRNRGVIESYASGTQTRWEAGLMAVRSTHASRLPSSRSLCSTSNPAQRQLWRLPGKPRHVLCWKYWTR